MVYEKGLADIKAKAMASESLSDYSGYVKNNSATEALDNTSTNERVKEDMLYYVGREVFHTIDDAKIFFSNDPAVAYDELISLLQTPEMRGQVVGYLTKSFNSGAPLEGFSEEANALHADFSHYTAIRRRALASEALTKKLKFATESCFEELKKKYPNSVSDDEAPEWETAEQEAERKRSNAERQEKRWGDKK